MNYLSTRLKAVNPGKCFRFILQAAAATVSIGVIMGELAQAGTIRHDRSDANYRNLATLFPSVGRLDLRFASNYSGCSGTLISSRWVLTAAHCFEDAAGQTLLSGGFTVGGRSYTISSGVINTNWRNSGRNLSQGFDLGLFQLSNAVQGIVPASLNWRTNEDLKVGTYVGFGRTGNGLTGYTASTGKFGTKQAGQNTIGLGSRLGYSNQVLVSDFDDPRLANSWDPLSQPQNLEYQLAPGDSGGALFIDGLLAGVNSFINDQNGNRAWSDYGDISATTRVSSHYNWIRNVMAARSAPIVSAPTLSPGVPGSGSPAEVELDESETLGDLPQPIELYDDVWDNSDPSAVAGIPEPTTIVGSLLALGGLVTARRRKSAHTHNASRG